MTIKRFFIGVAVVAAVLCNIPHAQAMEKVCSTDIDTLHRLCKVEVYKEDRLCRAEQKSYCVWKYSLCIRRCGEQSDAENALKLQERIQTLETNIRELAKKSLSKRRQCRDDKDCRISYYRNGCSSLTYSASRPSISGRIEKKLLELEDYIARVGDPEIACRRAVIVPSCNAEKTCVFKSESGDVFTP